MTPGERTHLAQLTQRVHTLEAQVQFLSRHLNIELPAQFGPNLDEVAELLKQGNKLEAIKRYRALTNTDLATAKAAVDQLGITLGFA